jgi:hypothetical protein
VFVVVRFTVIVEPSTSLVMLCPGVLFEFAGVVSAEANAENVGEAVSALAVSIRPAPIAITPLPSRTTTAKNTVEIRRDREDGVIGSTSKDRHPRAGMYAFILQGRPYLPVATI